jgi:ubiquinone/menaquinone biosynthesis C-methylase UbiE
MIARAQLFRIYGALRDRIAPGLLYSQRLYERRLAEILPVGADWLDLGCGHQVLPSWRAAAETELVRRCRSVTGIDFDHPSLLKHRSVRRRVRGDIGALPFADSSFDFVTANMVVEHLDDPDRQFREISRVLRPGGTLVVHTPNLYGYQTAISRFVPEFMKGGLIRLLDSRSAADVFPTHYRANTDAAIAEVGRKAGLDVVKIQMVATDAVFAVIPPLAAIELAAIRATMTDRLRRFRSDIIATFQKLQPISG